jgi:DNA phosphorothioation-associated putative methyltransferase
VRKVGDFGRANLVKIHIESGKVSLLAYDDFDHQPVPNLIERIKVNLWKGRVDYFDYIGGFAPPPLLMKSLFLPDDYAAIRRAGAL